MSEAEHKMQCAAAIEATLGELAVRLIPRMSNSADALEVCLAIAEIHRQEVGE